MKKNEIVCNVFKYKLVEKKYRATGELYDKHVRIYYHDDYGSIEVTTIVSKIIDKPLSKSKRYLNTIFQRNCYGIHLSDHLLIFIKKFQHEIAQEVQIYLLELDLEKTKALNGDVGDDIQ